MTSGLKRVNPSAQIDQASGVAEAISKIESGHYHVVVSDWSMPEGGGNAILEWMRASPEHRQIPFIMISANTEKEDIDRAYSLLGVDAYVIKPFSPQGLYDKIVEVLAKTSG